MPFKFRAAPALEVSEPDSCCREQPLSDLYHNVAVTAITDRFQPVEKRIFLSCLNLGQWSPLPDERRTPGRPPHKRHIDAFRVSNRSSC